jgi:hypothetical protein
MNSIFEIKALGGTRHLGEDFGMEPESKRHTMSHPPDRVADIDNNIGKSGKPNKSDKKKVFNLNYNKCINNKKLAKII